MIEKVIIDDILSLLEDCQFQTLLDRYFSEKFHWIIKGTSVLSGEYHDKAVFLKDVIQRLSDQLQDNWKMHILGVFPSDNVLVVEMRGEVKTKLGGDYNNEYCWIFHFEDHKVVKLVAYYDSLLVDKTLGVL